MSTEVETIPSFVERATRWLRANLSPKPDDGAPPTHERSRELQAKLFDAGYAGIAFPKAYGGAGLTVEHQAAFVKAAAPYEMPRAFSVSIGMLAPTILDYGSEVLKERHLPRMLRGEEGFIQLLSEPGGGSDLASALTRATRDGDTFVVNGSKMWSSGALNATHGLLLARTDWTVPKHRGLSMFVMPFKAAGVTVVPIRQVNGNVHFCQEFFDDVVLPADHLLGDENDGWAVAQRLLFHERNAVAGVGFGIGYGIGGGSQVQGKRGPADAVQDLVAAARQRDMDGDPEIRALIAEAYVEARTHRFATERVMAGMRSGKRSGPWASLLKLSDGMATPWRAHLALEVAGADGVIGTDEQPAGNEGEAWLNCRVISIAGGTNEIQRNIVAERLLGLPREYDPSRDQPFNELQRQRLAASGGSDGHR